MKWLFILLVVANLAFFGYTRLVEPPPPINWKAREIKADQVKIVAAEPAKPIASATSESPKTEVDATKPADPEAAPASDKAEAKSEPKPEPKPEKTTTPALACLVWRGILAEDLPNARKRLAGLKLTGEFKQEGGDSESPKRFWVYIPPRSTNEDAQKKAGELKALGVEDFFVVNDGSRWTHAISLGLFSSKEAADRRLDEVKQRGVRTAVSGQRGESTPVTTRITLHEIPVTVVSDLQQASKAFKGSTISEKGC